MDYIILSLAFLLLLYGIIRNAVTRGIDNSRLIKELKNEMTDLKKQIKKVEETKEEEIHLFDKKI
ncbi:hypothetical protein CD30_06165 [Ureibacillus massiliensis 4400831 = CIP 108448 = CCUG 49529]|uniref:Uncharacterized protein n=1 Tax=Ureibacillus massiliensis 4400831 = CIP 108448 = CCUG 49529 TaxID=1211035 RepID=A0A0A3J302_9BACL|nr:hypothetical protein [Ureibacillus massiliensis]KGR91399.1 hypothetical protein CD30_06165 [Ureibacillus massiliensis 4400831 = CIP 108448 = CCUG 49529]BDH62537.1 hypothetical protein MTP04_26670 [Lysinibacillus sp. PLM2]